MLDEKKRQEIEQAIAGMKETYPRMWRELYLGLYEQGFAHEDAMDLLKQYIHSFITAFAPRGGDNNGC